LRIFCADVQDHASFPAVVEWTGGLLEGEGLNVLVNNAGLAHWEGFNAVTRDLMLECLESNCIAPLMMAKVVVHQMSVVVVVAVVVMMHFCGLALNAQKP